MGMGGRQKPDVVVSGVEAVDVEGRVVYMASHPFPPLPKGHLGRLVVGFVARLDRVGEHGDDAGLLVDGDVAADDAADCQPRRTDLPLRGRLPGQLVEEVRGIAVLAERVDLQPEDAHDAINGVARLGRRPPDPDVADLALAR